MHSVAPRIWIRIVILLNALLLGYGNITGLPIYTFLLGDSAELPCDLNSTEDEVSLVLWHRDESGSPLYTVDARDLPLHTATHFPASEMDGRAFFNSSASTAFLKINGIRKDEEGMYRCRVEYRRARTETLDMMLNIIVPPREAIIMDEFGQHLHGLVGPYNEGQPVSLICEGEGGDPFPIVSWWKGTELLDDTFHVTPQGFARNEITLPPLRRTDLLTSLTCQVSNTNLTNAVNSTVSLDMNLRPTDVRITSPRQPLSAGHEVDIVCVARGARPPAQVSWWLNGEKLDASRITESMADEENLTISQLRLQPDVSDDLRNLSCRGDNPQLSDSVLEDSWIINVHYLPRLYVKTNIIGSVKEGSDVSMTCEVQSHPPITELEWLHDGRLLGTPSGANFSNRSFWIPAAGPQHKGEYQCAGTNSEGRAVSETLELQVLYAPRCESVRSSVYGVGRTESVSVTCAVDANPSQVNFSWVLSNADKQLPLPSVQFTSNGTKSVATVSPRAPQDYGVLQCLATNSIGQQKEPCSFRIIPAGAPEEPRNCQVTNRTSDCIHLDCESGEDGGLQQIFQLEVMSTGSDKFIANVTSRNSPAFIVCSLPPKESFVFVVYAVNNKGRSKQIAVRSSTLDGPPKEIEKEEDVEDLTTVLGAVLGAVLVLVVLVILISTSLKLKSRRQIKETDYQTDSEKCDAHLMKECKDTCVTNSHGPDIIPEKSYFQERSEPMVKICDSEDDANLSIVSVTDCSTRKYGEYQGVTFAEDSELISTPKKLRLLQEIEGDVEESGITVETPLISSIPAAVQQWTDHRKEGLRLSTPV